MAYYNHWGQLLVNKKIVEICNNGRPTTMLRVKTTHHLKNVKTFEKLFIVLGGEVTR
jgi:hypothetical protein